MSENGGVTSKEFYELQIEIKHLLQTYHSETVLVNQKLVNHIEDAKEKDAANKERFDELEDNHKELKKDLEAHKNVDGWFKGFSGLVSAAIVTVQLWLLGKAP